MIDYVPMMFRLMNQSMISFGRSGTPGAAYLDPAQLQQQIAAAAAVVAQPQPAHTGATGGLAQAVASIPQVVQQGVQQGVARSQTPKREASSPDTSTGSS